MAESHRAWMLGDHDHDHGWPKGGSGDDDEDLVTRIESGDEYDLYVVMGNEACWWYKPKRRRDIDL